MPFNRTTATRRRGFTAVELAAVLAVGIVATATSFVLLQPSPNAAASAARPPQSPEKRPKRNPRDTARQLKDATQIRNLIQAMVVFAMNNQDNYPLPSLLDRANHTVAEPGGAKDTTANIISILVFQGTVSTELLVSPAETNPNIRVFNKYEFADPKSAVTPARALWDPALSADFTDGNTGHISYAHLLPSGPRRAMWSNTFSTLEVALGNRGPEIASVTANSRGMVTATPARDDSNTYRIHGGPDSWEGNIAYNDAHVAFERTYGPRVDPSTAKWPTYTDRDGKTIVDTLFYDEPDDESGANVFLGIFTKGGEKPSEFKAIWD